MHGELFFSHDDKDKIAAVGLLTQRHEKRVNGDNAWKMRDAPKDYMKMMLYGIVAIEFKINKIEAKSKLSQNRETTDYNAVMDKMGELDLTGLEQRMRKLATREG